MSWYDTMAYAAWVGGSLPTEAQWEFAARGEEGRTYPWGEASPTPELANFRTSSTTPVTSHPDGRTPEGIHHLSGNVWEWCRDWYDEYSEGEQVDPLGPGSGPPSRVLRGGSFINSENNLRGATRTYRDPEFELNFIGFRVAWSAAGGQMN